MNKYYLFIIFAIIIMLGSCEEKKAQQQKKTYVDIANTPDQISWNVEVLFIDSSFTKAILHAKRARVYQQRMETLLDSGLQVDFMSKYSRKRVSLLTADSARIDDRTKNMLARGHVVVISDSSHTKLETNLLMWNNQTQKLYSTEFVRITSPREVLQGYGFESDQYLNNYKIFKVSGEQK